jgi:translocator protein
VERRPGVAVPGVLCCWASAVAVVAAYWAVDPLAGQLIAPSAVWISVAAYLIYSIWDINDRPGELYPTVGESRRIAERAGAMQ